MEVNIGILGAGHWARTAHLPNLRRVPGARVVAASSDSLERRARSREAWGGPMCFYEEAEDLIEDPGVHAVIVCTPNHTHEALTLRALAAGKHVLCEKPVALTPEGADRIGAALDGTSLVFQAGLELRYSDVARRMLELVRSGEIGEPRMLQCALMRDWGTIHGWRADPALSGGLMFELGIHYLDLFNMLAGGAPVRVFATGGHSGGSALADYAWATVEYDNAARACLGLAVITAPRNEIRLQVIGSTARLEAEILGGDLQLWRRGSAEPEDHSPPRYDGYGAHGFPGSLELVADWVHCIRTGASPVARLAVARSATALAAAAEASLRSAQPVSL